MDKDNKKDDKESYDINEIREEFKNLLKTIDEFYRSVENFIKSKDGTNQSDLDYIKIRIDEIRSKMFRIYRFDIMIKTCPVESWELKIDDSLIFNGKGKFNY